MQQDNNSVTSPKLKRLWVSLALAAVSVLCAPLMQRFLGFGSFPLRTQISSGAIVFALLAPAFWVALSPRSDVTRSIALIVLAVILVLAGVICLWLHPWSLHT
jgi:hypothetical protein